MDKKREYKVADLLGELKPVYDTLRSQIILLRKIISKFGDSYTLSRKVHNFHVPCIMENHEEYKWFILEKLMRYENYTGFKVDGYNFDRMLTIYPNDRKMLKKSVRVIVGIIDVTDEENLLEYIKEEFANFIRDVTHEFEGSDPVVEKAYSVNLGTLVWFIDKNNKVKIATCYTIAYCDGAWSILPNTTTFQTTNKLLVKFNDLEPLTVPYFCGYYFTDDSQRNMDMITYMTTKYYRVECIDNSTVVKRLTIDEYTLNKQIPYINVDEQLVKDLGKIIVVNDDLRIFN